MFSVFCPNTGTEVLSRPAPQPQPSLCNFIPEQKCKASLLGPYSHGQPTIFQISSHQTKPGTKERYFFSFTYNKEEGQMKFVCVEEQKLMGDVNSPPSWHRVETRYYNKMIYLTIWFL